MAGSAGVYRVLPVEQAPQGTTALFITVQLAASLGVALLGVLQTTHPGDWLTPLFATAAAAAAVIHVLSYALPGAPPSE